MWSLKGDSSRSAWSLVSKVQYSGAESRDVELMTQGFPINNIRLREISLGAQEGALGVINITGNLRYKLAVEPTSSPRSPC